MGVLIGQWPHLGCVDRRVETAQHGLAVLIAEGAAGVGQRQLALKALPQADRFIGAVRRCQGVEQQRQEVETAGRVRAQSVERELLQGDEIGPVGGDVGGDGRGADAEVRALGPAQQVLGAMSAGAEESRPSQSMPE